MKAAVLYLVVLVGSAALGAASMGAYTALTTEPAEQAAGADGGEDEHAGPAGAEGPDAGRQVTRAGEAGPDAQGGDPGAAETTPGTVVESGAEEDRAAQTDVATAQVEEETAPPSDPAPGVGQTVGLTANAAPEPDPDSLARLAQNYQRLARIFSAMKPDQAAPVLAQLDDRQLEGILLAMQGRNAAPILAEMDPARAAALSRKVLRGNE